MSDIKLKDIFPKFNDTKLFPPMNFCRSSFSSYNVDSEPQKLHLILLLSPKDPTLYI